MHQITEPQRQAVDDQDPVIAGLLPQYSRQIEGLFDKLPPGVAGAPVGDNALLHFIVMGLCGCDEDRAFRRLLRKGLAQTAFSGARAAHD
jgi:hypothetical protein